MATTVNQCMLSQIDFDFMIKMNALSELNNQLQAKEFSFILILIVLTLFVVGAVIAIILAFKLHKHKKTAATVIIAFIVSMALVIGVSVYNEFNSIKSLKTETAGISKALKTMDKPDTKLFEACSEPNAIVELAPNRDDPDFESSFESKIILD